MKDNLKILRNEFDSGEDSFLIKLRCELKWDKNAFLILIIAMEKYCDDNLAENKLEKWVAEGFWYISHFVKDWSTHPNFSKEYSLDYYEKAYEILWDLSFYYFTGNHPKINKSSITKQFIAETK